MAQPGDCNEDQRRHPRRRGRGRLGRAALEVGAYRDAYQTLSSLAERAEGAERTQLLQDAARAAEKGGLYGPSLQLAVDMAGESSPEAAGVRQAVVNSVSASNSARHGERRASMVEACIAVGRGCVDTRAGGRFP